MAVKRLRVSAIAAKIETVSGTDSVPTLALNAVRFVGVPSFSPDYIENGLRDDVQFGGMGSVGRASPAGRFGQLTVRMEARGSGTDYTAGASKPEVDVFLRAAGFAPTNTGATWTYDSLDDGFETMSLYIWVGTLLYKMVGCVVQPKLGGTVNQRCFWDFTVTGIVVSDPINETLGAITHNATIPPLWANNAVSIGAFDYAAGLHARSFELDFPTTVATRGSAGAPDGLIGYAITDRKARLSMEIEQVDLSVFDPHALAREDGSGPTDTDPSITIGTAAFNRLLIEGGHWALERPQPGDNTGLGLWQLTGELVAGSLAANSRESRISFT